MWNPNSLRTCPPNAIGPIHASGFGCSPASYLAFAGLLLLFNMLLALLITPPMAGWNAACASVWPQPPNCLPCLRLWLLRQPKTMQVGRLKNKN